MYPWEKIPTKVCSYLMKKREIILSDLFLFHWVFSIRKILKDYTPTWDIRLSLKKYPIKLMLFPISMRKTKSPREKNFFVTFRTSEKIEVKRGHFFKKWEFGQTKKKLIYQFFKTRICTFMTYGQFLPKISTNLRFVIRDSRIRGLKSDLK